ncbi:MAG: branched-chain amino acid ABC transporter permease [Gammaproteobacteria bacterium]|nr:branched-chain amino acid ABC transporter permease [Gammaproteobacteria bacterium]NIU07163.1 branched-chain amino acid ABC transporter permease [Gammaproteobacteria bacterium]NIX88436.1 branched-chain amino acid ABC transporter permease [Gammaproteobacteria bacterium]
MPRPYQKALVGGTLVFLLLVPVFVSSYNVHLLNLAALATIAAIGLNLLTGYCGQISLGHAAFLAIGAFTTVVLTVHAGAPFWVVVPVSGAAGAIVGFIIGLPSLRFRGIYLAISTLAMHYAVVYGVTSYQAKVGPSASAGITIADPQVGPVMLSDDRSWYYFLLGIVLLVTVFSVNLVRTRAGRAWMAIRDRDIAAEALGVDIAHYKLLAFMVSSTLASVAGSLAAYYNNVVTAETYTLDLAVVYLAMIIVGGMGSVLGAVFGAVFITLLPFGIDALFEFAPRSWRYGSEIFGVKQGAVGLCIILFLLFEPKGLVEIWHRIETYFERWPFRYRPLEAERR